MLVFVTSVIQEAFFTYCEITEGTGVADQINDGFIPFMCGSCRAQVLCDSLARLSSPETCTAAMVNAISDTCAFPAAS